MAWHQWGKSDIASVKIVWPSVWPKFRIKCSVCQEEKAASKHFSSKQIDEYKEFHRKSRPSAKSSNRNGGSIDLYIRCKVCVGVRREEMKCRICHKLKSMDWFALAQRKDPDNAKCRTCMRAIELVLPSSSNPRDTGVVDQNEGNSSYGNRSNDPFHKNLTGVGSHIFQRYTIGWLFVGILDWYGWGCIFCFESMEQSCHIWTRRSRTHLE